MTKKVRRTPNDEQPKPEAIRPRRVQPMKRIEHTRQMLLRYADPGVMNLDTDVRTAAPTANQNPPASRRMLKRIAQQVSEHGFQQNRVAHDGSSGRAEPQLKPLLRRRGRLVTAQSGEEGLERDRRLFHATRLFVQAQSLDEAIELAGEPRNGQFPVFDELSPAPLRMISRKQRECAENNL